MLCVTLTHGVGIKSVVRKIDTLYKRAICENARISEDGHRHEGENEPGHLAQVRELAIENLPGCFDRYANVKKSFLGGFQRAHFGKVVEDRLSCARPISFLPLIVAADERLKISIDGAKLTESAQKQRDESLVRKQTVDKRKDIK